MFYVEYLMSTHWALRFVHFLYTVFATIASWLQRRNRTRPKPLKAHRSKIPKHLCLNLVAHDGVHVEEMEAAFLQCLQSVATWCRELEIDTLSVYDRYGILHGCPENARQHVFVVNEASGDSCESEVEYPLTPPLSDSPGSRSRSLERETLPLADLHTITMKHHDSSHIRKRRNVAVRRQPKTKDIFPVSSNLTLHIISRASGKPAIVTASRSLLRRRVRDAWVSDDGMHSEFPCSLAVSELGMMLEAGFPPPDFMIIHHISGMKIPYPPVELYGFPPWQNTLTEFQCVWPDCPPGPDYIENSRTDPDDSKRPPGLISETAFCRALDEYAGAEFRLGR